MRPLGCNVDTTSSEKASEEICSHAFHLVAASIFTSWWERRYYALPSPYLIRHIKKSIAGVPDMPKQPFVEQHEDGTVLIVRQVGE